MHAIFSVAGYSFRAANQTLFWFVFLIHKPCHTLKKVSGMWRMRKTSQNRHWQFCRGRGSAGDFFFFLHMCAYVWISHFDFTHFLVLIVHVCMQVWFKPGNFHKHMHAFCSGSLSTNYWRNLYARRFPAAITNSATGNAQNFLSWLASSPPPATALVIPLSTYGTLFLPSAHHCQGEGNLTQHGRNQITQK